MLLVNQLIIIINHLINFYLTNRPQFFMVYTLIWRHKMLTTQVEPRATGGWFHWPMSEDSRAISYLSVSLTNQRARIRSVIVKYHSIIYLLFIGMRCWTWLFCFLSFLWFHGVLQSIYSCFLINTHTTDRLHSKYVIIHYLLLKRLK